MARPFKGLVKLDICDSKPDWDAFLDNKAPKGAPNVARTTRGFYLLAGPGWKGETPKGITRVFRSTSNTGIAAPRIAQSDDPEDKKTVQVPLRQVLMYPLAEYDGRMKSIKWSELPRMPFKPTHAGETKWVVPEKFFDELPAVLSDASPFPGEEARYAQVLAVLEALKKDPALEEPMIQAAAEVEEQIITPLFAVSKLR